MYTEFWSCVLSDQLHSIAIAEMGNYQDFLKHVAPPLREADADQPKRLHTFGNPFKLDKKVRVCTCKPYKVLRRVCRLQSKPKAVFPLDHAQ